MQGNSTLEKKRKVGTDDRTALFARIRTRLVRSVRDDAHRFDITNDIVVDSIVGEFFSQFSTSERAAIYAQHKGQPYQGCRKPRK